MTEDQQREAIWHRVVKQTNVVGNEAKLFADADLFWRSLIGLKRTFVSELEKAGIPNPYTDEDLEIYITGRYDNALARMPHIPEDQKHGRTLSSRGIPKTIHYPLEELSGGPSEENQAGPNH